MLGFTVETHREMDMELEGGAINRSITAFHCLPFGLEIGQMLEMSSSNLFADDQVRRYLYKILIKPIGTREKGVDKFISKCITIMPLQSRNITPSNPK